MVKEIFSQNEREHLVDKQGHASVTLTKLLEVMGITHNGTLETIVPATQKEWLRLAGKERWQIEDRFADKKEQVMPLLKKLGFVDEFRPKKNQYDYALLHGVNLDAVRSRLAFLIDLYNKGVRFDTFVILSGARKLDPSIENEETLLDAHNKELPFKKGWRLKGQLPEMETAMVELVYNQTDLGSLKEVPLVVVDAPMHKNSSGQLVRPDTGDTIVEWLKLNPKPGSCLAISDQPQVMYQDVVFKTFVTDPFIIETVGPAAPVSTKIAVYLDAVARKLYQKREWLKKNSYEVR